jgi:hypothetical protein
LRPDDAFVATAKVTMSRNAFDQMQSFSFVYSFNFLRIIDKTIESSDLHKSK